MQGPHSRAVSCPLCNEKFFPASLPFHQKQCEQRRATRRVNCPYCSVEVTQLDLPKHIERCPKGAARRQQGRGGGGKDETRSGGGGGGGRPQTSAGPPGGDGQFDAEVLDDGRMRCIYCGRYFNPERLDKHQQICSNLKNARPKGPDGQPTQTCRKVFNAEAQRVGGGPCFVTPEKYEQKQKATQMALQRERKKHQSAKWRREHEDFLAACRAGKGDETLRTPASPAQHHGKVQCPHCARYFDANAAERHIPICANVVNRARPPPSPGPSHSSELRRGGDSGAASPSPRTRHSGDARPPRSPMLGRGASPAPPRTGGPNAPRAVGGGGCQAARSLRTSHGRLPGLPPQSTRGSSPDRLAVSDGASPGADSDGAARRTASVSRGGSARMPSPGAMAETLDLTATPRTRRADAGRGGRAASPSPGQSVQRIGLRRSAMLYRLLTQVPEEALVRELQDCGVEAEDMQDREALIEAILEQLQ